MRYRQNNTEHIRFVVSVFGQRYFGMLIAVLYSIKKSNPESNISVFYQDISEQEMDNIVKVFNNIEFVKTQFIFRDGYISRVSSKTLLWGYMLSHVEDGNVVIMDVDMLVIKPLNHFFERDFDILFTTKINENAPINTGIMLVRNSHKTIAFFKQWQENTENILKSLELMKISSDQRYPYGGADQMAFYQMINFDKKKMKYTIDYGNDKLELITEECKILNETNSTNISPETHVIHYKGGVAEDFAGRSEFYKKEAKK